LDKAKAKAKGTESSTDLLVAVAVAVEVAVVAAAAVVDVVVAVHAVEVLTLEEEEEKDLIQEVVEKALIQEAAEKALIQEVVEKDLIQEAVAAGDNVVAHVVGVVEAEEVNDPGLKKVLRVLPDAKENLTQQKSKNQRVLRQNRIFTVYLATKAKVKVREEKGIQVEMEIKMNEFF